jgi:hypothetical protein
VTAPPPHPRRLRDALEPWCAAGATGALRALDPPGGSVYLRQGRISFAESPPACGIDRLLTASGQLSGEDWRAALVAGRPAQRVGDTLVQHGLIARAELEAVVLAALYGAALFLLDLDTEVRFEMGAGHPVGPVVDLDLPTMCAEVDRRRRALAEAWPESKVDVHAVVPARRLPGQHVALTALQWEIVANADRRRTPVELARSLGRDTFATLWEVRRLTRAGLVEPGRPGATHRVREVPAGVPAPRERPAGAADPDGPDAAATPDHGPGRDHDHGHDHGGPGAARFTAPDDDPPQRDPPALRAAGQRARHRGADGNGPAEPAAVPLPLPLPRRQRLGLARHRAGVDRAGGGLFGQQPAADPRWA